MISREKIRPEHLQRAALVYVRQSSLTQIRQHHESRRRQYDLQGQAHALGWRDVVLIDEDLGKSGATAAGRPGFQRLVAEVSLGHAGAIFSLEVSRLARNNRDWYQLLDLCGLMNTLIVDAEGIYDPRQLNDRLLLGLKGTMSEAELGWLRQRAHEGLLAKARRGALILGVPVGYVQTPDGRVEKHPDQRIQQALALVFEKFAASGSVRQTLLWFRQERVVLPSSQPAPLRGEGVTWRLPVYATILKIVTNPCYAGAYAFGRTFTRITVVDGRPQKSRGHRQARDQWLVLLRDHHEPYIAWEVYERNQQIIAHNSQMKGLMVKGAVRHGPSLIPGLLRCGHCGRRLHVGYSGSRYPLPRYSCHGAAINHGAGRCISFGGGRIDEAVGREVVRVLAPGAVEAALRLAADAGEEGARVRQAVDLELREARYEAERAHRQYDAVEPEHRLVAATLERRWNEALARVHELEARAAAVAAEATRRTAPDRETLLQLAEDFPRVWNDRAIDMRTKKRIVRLLIEEIVARVVAEPRDHIELTIHWKGGKHTQLTIPRNVTGRHRRSTDRAIVDVVRDLSRVQPDEQIARVLNRLGYRTGAGNTWTQLRVRSLRSYHEIPPFDRVTDRPNTLTVAAAASLLGVATTTVRRLIALGVLPATQPVLYAPWAIRREDVEAQSVQRLVAAVKAGRPLPRTRDAGQLMLEESIT
jgi:excisionase family DNA binding protein